MPHSRLLWSFKNNMCDAKYLMRTIISLLQKNLAKIDHMLRIQNWISVTQIIATIFAWNLHYSYITWINTRTNQKSPGDGATDY